MAQFGAAQVGLSVAASATNLQYWVLTQLTAGNISKIKMYNWGGGDTSLIACNVRWCKVSNTPATPAALTIQQTSAGTGITPNSSVNTYTTPATGTSGAGLFQQFFNTQGGGGTIVLPIGGEWFVTGGALGTLYNQIGCGVTVGTSSNLTFGLQFEE
jgi:hypothetical protein